MESNIFSQIKDWWVNFDANHQSEGITRSSRIKQLIFTNVVSFAIVSILINSDKWEKKLPIKPEN